MIRAARRYNIQQLHLLLAEHTRFLRLGDQTNDAIIQLDDLLDLLEETALDRHPISFQLMAYRQHLVVFQTTCRTAAQMVVTRIERLFNHLR